MEPKKVLKPADSKADTNHKCKIVSKIDFEEDSETEIAAEISLPKEGGWGWMVVAASFICIFILDGIFFTFGSIYKDITEDLEADVSVVALTNSVAIGLYFLSGPVVSALINRFGFRTCTMTGSIIVSFAYLVSYFLRDCITLLLFYGILAGFGGCFIYMSSQLVVGFYFERLRALAMAISGLGQSFGVMTMSFVNTHLVKYAGWRTATLLHSGLFATIYFVGMAYRPLVTLTVIKESDESNTIKNYLRSLSTMSIKTSGVIASQEIAPPSAAERLFNAPSNACFPTAAEVLEADEEEEEDNDEGRNNDNNSEPGPSSESTRKFTLTINNSQGTVSEAQLKQVRSMMSRNSLVDNDRRIEILMNTQTAEKKKWWKRLCHWEKHVDEARPMYRDDAFYNGRLENLPAYKKSMMDARGEKTGLEYRMAVSRTVTTVDLRENKGCLTPAVRRILATMMDPQLLNRRSFIMVCATGFLIHIGLLVPYVFLPDRNGSEGIEKTHCDLFVSVIGFSNAVGRLIAGIIACKYNPVRLYCCACFIAGVALILSNFYFNVYYQYFCCVVFGISVAHISTLRSLVIVDLYGLDNLTNATGVLLMFQGFGSLISTPLSSVLKNNFGYNVSFYVAGSFVVLGSLIILRVKTVATREAKLREKIYLVSRKRSTLQRVSKTTEKFKSMPSIPEKNT